MANLQFSSEILDDILFRAGEKTDGTSDYEAQALIYLNRAYRALYMGGGEFSPKFREQWYWMEENDAGSASIEPVIKAGTVTVTRGSTAITFTSAPAISVADYRFRVDGDEEMSRIASHTAGAVAATLSVPYNGTTGSGKNYRVMRFEYLLPTAAIRVVSPIYFYRDGGRKCELVDISTIKKTWISGQDLMGVPEHFAMDTETRILFDRYGSDTEGEFMLYELAYKQRPADLTNSGTEEPLVPRQWRHVLSDMALFFVYTDKDDSRAGLIGKQVEAGLEAMKQENRALLAVAGEPGHIYPRGQPVVRRVRTSSGKLIGYFR